MGFNGENKTQIIVTLSRKLLGMCICFSVAIEHFQHSTCSRCYNISLVTFVSRMLQVKLVKDPHNVRPAVMTLSVPGDKPPFTSR